MNNPSLFSPPRNPDPLKNFLEKKPFSCQGEIDLPDYLFFQRVDHDYMAEAVLHIPQNDQEQEAIEQIDQELDTWADHYSKRRNIEKQVADYLREQVAPLGMIRNIEAIADKLDHCRESGFIGINQESGGKIVKWDYKCGQVKLCPDEARAEQQRLTKRYVPAAMKWLEEKANNRSFQYAVFTVENPALGDLGQCITDSFKKLRDLIRTKHFENVKGVFVTLEDPLSQDGQSWNVHFNLLLLVEGHFNWQAVREAWGFNIEFQDEREMYSKTVQRFPQITHDRRSVLRVAFQEVVKYASKHIGGKDGQQGITGWPPGAFVEWWLAHHGLRRSRTYGELHGVEAPKPEYVDVRLILWCGSVSFSNFNGKYQIKKRPAIDLIQENKSAFQNHQKRANPHHLHPGGLDPCQRHIKPT